MQRIFFCTGSSFLTGDSIARAMLDYAQALAELSKFDTVDLPMRRLDGSEGRAHLLLGPMSQISMESVQTQLPDVRDVELVERLRESAAQLRDPLVVRVLDEDDELFASSAPDA